MSQFECHCNKCDYRLDKMVARWNTVVRCPICRDDVTKLMSAFAVGGSRKSGAQGLLNAGAKDVQQLLSCILM